MVLNEQERKAFDEVVRPLVKWLNENCHPHVVAVIEPYRASLHEGVYSTPVEDFIPD
jgi:hypothetical protein